MAQFSGSALEVRVLWSSRHTWPPGQEYHGPCYAYALWLMLEGEAEVRNTEQCWQVKRGDAFLWPKDQQRQVTTHRGASWLSLGFDVTALGQVNVLSLLALPALKTLEPNEHEQLCLWIGNMVSIRDKLTHSTPENQRVARYFESVDSLAALPSYDQWMNQIVAERPSFYDVIEEGLARAVFGWVWNLWGPNDLEKAIHYKAPLWLQNALLQIRQHPAISVQELAKASGFSLAQFRRVFHHEMGQSPRDYLQRQRLEVARHLIENTELPIATVAVQTGFSSVPHFIQLWKQSHGASPLQYRLARKTGHI